MCKPQLVAGDTSPSSNPRCGVPGKSGSLSGAGLGDFWQTESGHCPAREVTALLILIKRILVDFLLRERLAYSRIEEGCWLGY